MLSARLKLIGGCRNAGDEERVAALRREAAGLQIADFVDFHTNAPWHEVAAAADAIMLCLLAAEVYIA